MILYLFDIDGTLLHAHGAGRGAFDAGMRERFGIADASVGIRYGGKTDPAIVEEIFVARLGRVPTQAERDAFFDAYLPRLRALLATQGAVVIDGVLEALEFLSRRDDATLGIATGNIRAGAQAKLEAAQLASWFAPGAIGGYGCDSHVRAELVAKGIERGRAAAASRELREVVVVGDTIHDISAARACGATVVAVATGADPADKLAHADAVLSSLAELPTWHVERFDATARQR